MTLHSQILGSGKPFVILHGFLGMSDNWKTLGTRWAEAGYEVHLLDQRNHGRSFHSDEFSYELMSEDLKNYCEEHSLKEIILLGHSMGGKVAMQFAVTYPEMVSKLVWETVPKLVGSLQSVLWGHLVAFLLLYYPSSGLCLGSISGFHPNHLSSHPRSGQTLKNQKAFITTMVL